MRVAYYTRILDAYIFNRRSSNSGFWHTPLRLNEIEDHGSLGRYYMNFSDKTAYGGPFDAEGVPMLDYKGRLGVRYNPNAVAQYGLGHYDLFLDTGKEEYKDIFLKQAEWFLKNIRYIDNETGLWEYNFDFEYHKGLKAPWRSALAQGQGISVMARAYRLTGNDDYLGAASKAFEAFRRRIDEPGGVTYVDGRGYLWLEELIFDPPTHVLNGFIWALWGIYDYYLLAHDQAALDLFREGVRTLEDKIHKYDIGFWSVYHLVPTKLRMISSPYYQRLHAIQLEAMHRLTGKSVFRKYADRWKGYYFKRHYRYLALSWKALFKIFYY